MCRKTCEEGMRSAYRWTMSKGNRLHPTTLPTVRVSCGMRFMGSIKAYAQPASRRQAGLLLRLQERMQCGIEEHSGVGRGRARRGGGGRNLILSTQSAHNRRTQRGGSSYGPTSVHTVFSAFDSAVT